MKKNLDENLDLEEFKKILEDFDESDFDGHTNFQELTPKQKLEWLSQLIYFKYVASKNN